jgi:hypothetical protein
MWKPSAVLFALRWMAYVPWIAVTTGSVGCSDGHDVVPVSGVVKVDGQPFPGARINTQPIATSMEDPNPGPGSFGTTDQNGRYTLELATHPEPGAVVGKHSVTVTMEADAFSADPTSDLPQPVSRKLPPWFTDNSIIIEIPEGGTDTANLDLSLKAPPG